MAIHEGEWPGRGKMFQAEELDEFWAYGVGAMRWTNLDGHQALHVILPGRIIDSVNVVDGATVRVDIGMPSALYVLHAENNWAEPGNVPGWDGDLENPTLEPSIVVPGDGGGPERWHGFIVRGKLSASQSGD